MVQGGKMFFLKKFNFEVQVGNREKESGQVGSRDERNLEMKGCFKMTLELPVAR